MTANRDFSSFPGLKNTSVVNSSEVETTTAVERTMIANGNAGACSSEKKHIAPEATFLSKLDAP